MRTPGPRRGARARLLPVGGASRPTAARCRPTSPRTPSRSTRRASTRRALRAELLHVVVVRRLRQGRARGGRGRGGAGREPTGPSPRRSSPRFPSGCASAQGAFAATGGIHATGLFDRRGRRCSCVREDVGRHNAMDKVVGWAFGEELLPLAESDPLRQRPALVRARPEGGGRRLSGPRRRRRAVEPRGRARGRPRDHALRLRSRRPRERLHRAVAPERLTGVLLVGGASTRFGSPKALARLGGETLGGARVADARRRPATSGSPSARSRTGSSSPFPIVDDGTDVRAPIAGVVAGLAPRTTRPLRLPARRLPARHGRRCSRRSPAACADADAAVPQTGPLPGAYRRAALPALQRRLAAERLSLRDALAELDSRTIELDEPLLANVNTVDDLQRLLTVPGTSLARPGTCQARASARARLRRRRRPRGRARARPLSRRA